MNVLDGILKKLDDLAKRVSHIETQSTPRWVYLTTPLTSTSWDGDSFSNVADPTQLDLSAVFGTPAGIKAVLLEIVVKDSAAWGADLLYFCCGPSATYYDAVIANAYGGDIRNYKTEVCPCDANGDVWYEINASGVDTMDIVIRIYGYYI